MQTASTPVVHRSKLPDAEKITINLGYVDLGQIDLLVQKASMRTAPTSSAPPSATSSPTTATR